MSKKQKTNEGLSDLAHIVDKDHEVQMARSDLYKIAKYAIKLHDMLKDVHDLEGWQQSKITKASDYISAVYHNLDYDLNVEKNDEFDIAVNPVTDNKNDSYKKSLEEQLKNNVKKIL